MDSGLRCNDREAQFLIFSETVMLTR